MTEIDNNVPENILRVDIFRIGLPLTRKGFVTVCTAMLLFVVLQYKLSHTFLAEGSIAVLAIIFYIAIRIFFLRSEYPKELGAIEITKDMVSFPSCVSSFQKAFEVNKDAIRSIEYYRVKQRGTGFFLTSIDFTLKNGEVISLNLFSINLETLKDSLLRKNYRFDELESTIYKNVKMIFLVFIVTGIVYIIYKLNLLN